MKVKITNGAKNHWYENLTGSVFNVLECSQNLEAYLVETPERCPEGSYIYMRDCEEIDDDFNGKLLKAYLDGIKDDNMRQSILAVARHEHQAPEIEMLKRSGHVLTTNNPFPVPELEERLQELTKNTPDQHYDNSNGSLYKFAEDHNLNAYEFDIVKRIVRCRKKGQFKSDLEKTKRVIDIYLSEHESMD